MFALLLILIAFNWFCKLNALNSSQSGNGMKCNQFDKYLNYFIQQPKYDVMDRFTSKIRQIAAGFIGVTFLENLIAWASI